MACKVLEGREKWKERVIKEYQLPIIAKDFWWVADVKRKPGAGPRGCGRKRGSSEGKQGSWDKRAAPTSSRGDGSRGTGPHSACTAAPRPGPLPPAAAGTHNTQWLQFLTAQPAQDKSGTTQKENKKRPHWAPTIFKRHGHRNIMVIMVTSRCCCCCWSHSGESLTVSLVQPLKACGGGARKRL